MNSYFAFFTEGGNAAKTPINQFDSDDRARLYYQAIKGKKLIKICCFIQGSGKHRVVYQAPQYQTA